jgi:RepB DNA-primase from phage plasmid
VGSGVSARQLVRQRLEGWEDRQRDRQLRRSAKHEYYRVYNSGFSGAQDKTYEAVEGQLGAMGSEIFEVGALQRGDGDQPQFMLLRSWDRERLVSSIPWLLYQNWHGSHIYVRPKGESNLTLIDDLKAEAVAKMWEEGYQPAVVVQTSPGNYQVWVKHAEKLDRELGTAVARDLARRFGGDVKAADWRHFGRLAGFRNTKEKYKQIVEVPGYEDWRKTNFRPGPDGHWVDKRGNEYQEERLHQLHTGLLPTTRFPFVRLVGARGAIAREGAGLVARMRDWLEKEHAERARAQARYQAELPRLDGRPLKGIEAFRVDPRYGGDGTRVDLAYAVYAVARGVDLASVKAALGSRDLSHKGNPKRQSDYIERTVRKALVSVEQGRGR